MKNAVVPVICLLIIGTAWSSGAEREPQPEASGTLEIYVAVVGNDLSVNPVPKADFLIYDKAIEGGQLEVTTSFKGHIEVTLPVGLYIIVSAGPIDFQGQRFSWDLQFAIDEGKVTSLELSNDNATIVGLKRETPESTAEGEIYERYKDAVVKIVSDSGKGSGFLISREGLILTNHHVIADSEYLAVKFADGRKHELVLLAEDSRHDIAALWVNPGTVEDMPLIELAADSRQTPAVVVGQRVLAIGSPLTTETILTSGLVSKIEEDTLFSDVNINPGNSGGPLLDLNGRAVGITTFGVGGSVGPGFAGIIRIHAARPLLEEAVRVMGSSDPPSTRSLPVASDYRFSPDDLKDTALSRAVDLKSYRLEAGKFDVHIVTPVAFAAEILRREREAAAAHDKRMRKKHKKQRERGEEPEEYEPGQSFYEWQKNSENFRPTVHIRAYPEIKMTAGSAFAVAMTGQGGKFRFKADFDRMELWSGAELIEPIHPGRVKEVVHAGNAAASMKDVGYYGLYEYPPEAFTGGSLKLLIWKEGVEEPIEVPISNNLAVTIRVDFAPYFDYVEQSKKEPMAGGTPF